MAAFDKKSILDATFSGDFNETKRLLQAIVRAEWPEIQNKIYIREEWKDNPPPAPISANTPFISRIRTPTRLDPNMPPEMRDWVDFVVQSYRLANPNHPNELSEANETSLRVEAQEIYKDNIQTEGDNNRQGRVTAHNFSYSTAISDTSPQARENFEIQIIHLNSATCDHCTTSLSGKFGNPLNCEPVSPDLVAWERINSMQTAIHELGHAIRGVERTPEQRAHYTRRDEETTVMVFSNLMLAQALGPMGIGKLQNDIALSARADRLDNFYYEATAPLQAALDYIQQQPVAFAQASPRKLLSLATELVKQHDPVNHMSTEQANDYMHFLTQADLSPEAAKQRLDIPQRPYTPSPPSPAFNGIALNKVQMPGEVLPYPPEARKIDEVIYQYSLREQRVLAEIMLHNPLRPSSMRNLPIPISDNMGGDQEIISDFSRFNESLRSLRTQEQMTTQPCTQKTAPKP